MSLHLERERMIHSVCFPRACIYLTHPVYLKVFLSLQILSEVTKKRNEQNFQYNGKLIVSRVLKKDAIPISEPLSGEMLSLCISGDYSDITFIVEGRQGRPSGHKVILEARSEYFCAVLYGGLPEAN